MDGSVDFAFNSYGWAYRTGREGRKQRQIIRTLRITHDSKTAHLTPSIPFEPREEQLRWTDKALEVKNVPRDELAVVVGELLPTGYCDDLKKNLKSAKSPMFFNPSVHDSIDPAPEAGILVKVLKHKRCTLFLLHQKENGLYHKAWLPTDAKDRVVFYREWAADVSGTQEKVRTAQLSTGIVNFTKAYMEQHKDDFCDTVDSAAWEAEKDGLRCAPKEAIFSYIHQAIKLWEDGGERGHLEQAYDTIMGCLGRTNWEEVEGTKDADNLKLLQLMIEGRDDFDMEEANEASRACQALWRAPTDGPGSILPEALFQLARGLRAGAMLETPIDESLYRAFITLFCAEHTAGRAEGDHALHGAIQTAYSLASASVGQPLNTHEPRTSSSNHAIELGLLERFRRLKRAQLRAIKQAMAAERDVVMKLSGPMTEIVSPEKLIEEIGSTWEVVVCRELAVKLFQMSFMRHALFAQSMATQAATELRLLNSFCPSAPDDDSEDDGDGEVEDGGNEDDDEAMPDVSEMEEDA